MRGSREVVINEFKFSSPGCLEDAELVSKIGKSEGACLDEKVDVLGLESVSFEVLKKYVT